MSVAEGTLLGPCALKPGQNGYFLRCINVVQSSYPLSASSSGISSPASVEIESAPPSGPNGNFLPSRRAPAAPLPWQEPPPGCRGPPVPLRRTRARGPMTAHARGAAPAPTRRTRARARERPLNVPKAITREPRLPAHRQPGRARDRDTGAGRGALVVEGYARFDVPVGLGE